VSSTITATGVGVGMATAFITSFVVRQAASLVGTVVGGVVGGIAGGVSRVVGPAAERLGSRLYGPGGVPQDGFTGTMAPSDSEGCGGKPEESDPGAAIAISTWDLCDESSTTARDYLALLTFDFGEEEEEEGVEGPRWGSAVPT
jgi:hypothetical protein